MIFNCAKENLIDSLNIVVKAAPVHSTMSILSCILLESNGDSLKMSATDLDMGIEVKNIEAEIIEPGSVALESRMLFDIVRRMPEGIINVSINEKNVAVLKCGKTELKILGLNSDEFPEIPQIEKDNGYNVSCVALKDIVRQTLFAASVDESKAVLTGILFDIEKDTLTVVAVDGIRVAVKTVIVTPMQNTESVYSVIPSKALNEISKIIPSEKDDILSIYFTDKHILFEMNNFMVVTRALDGEFIKYEQVFNEDSTTVIYINRQELLYSLERALLITAKDIKKNPVYFKISENLLSITSQTESGTSFDELSVEMDGDDLEISFNPKYLSDVARVIDEDEVKMQFTSSLSPCTIRGRDNEDYKYLLLPLRIKM